MNLPYSYILLLLCCITYSSAAQENYTYTRTVYNSENGLAGNYANYIHKDSRGILWFGTQHGLHRFDGHDFKIFDEDTGLPFNHVMEIYEDAEGWLWLYRSCQGKDKDYCYKDIVFFHSITHEIKSLEVFFEQKVPFNPREIEWIRSSSNFQIQTITTPSATYRYTPKDGLKKVPPNRLDKSPNVFTVLNDGRMGAYFKDETTFLYYLIDAKGRILDQQHLENEKYPAINFLVSSVRCHQNIYRRNGKYKYTNNRSLFPDDFDAFKVNQEGELVPDTLTQLAAELGVFVSRHIWLDEATNTIWTAHSRGIKAITIQPQYFNNILLRGETRHLAMLHPVTGSTVRHNYGMYDYKRRKNTWDKKGMELLAENTKNAPPLKDFFHPENQLLPSKKSLGVRLKNGTYKIQTLKKLKVTQFDVCTDYVRIRDTVWLATDKGIWSYTNGFASLKKVNQFKIFAEAYVHYIHAIDSTNYWVATNKGLFRWSLSKGIVAQYSDRQKGAFYIPVSNIYHLTIAKDGTLWLAAQNGLVQLSTNGNPLENQKTSYQLWTKKEGFPSSTCSGVYQDKTGFLWIATTKGLVQLNPKSKRFKTYNKREGLEVEYFLEYGHYQSPSGDLVFCATKGLVHFHPKDFKSVNFEASEIPIIVVDFEQYDKNTGRFERKTADFLTNQTITLPSEARIFNLTVALADYRNANRHQFSYRIKGYQDEWQLTDNQIRISGLPYGIQTLEIRGQLADGQYSKNILAIPVTVLRPFYLQTWFVVLSIIALMLSIYLGLRYRTYQLEQRQKELKVEVKERTAQIQKDKEIIEQQASELQKLDKMKSRFFANVSHELRTPLTLMLAPIDSTLKGNQLTNKDFTNLTIAQRNGKRLQRLINEILDLTKLESGKLTLQTSTVVLYDYLKLLVANFESLANSKGIAFQLNYELSHNLQIELDEYKFEIVLFNLLSNAFKFTPSQGKVTLTIDLEENFLRFRVRDTGRGIHPDDVPFIFDRFYQTSEQHSVAEGGTGIGLTLTQELVALMNGQIKVESAINEGTLFTVLLPKTEIISQVPTEAKLRMLNNDYKADIETNLIVEPKSDSSEQPTILLVEDNEDLRFFIHSILSETYQVIVAENGQVALEQLDKYPIQLILTDIMMPIMNGYQLVQTVKSNEKYAQLPIIVLTAKAALGDKLKVLRIGVDDYLSKPFVQEELLVRIQNLLQNAVHRKLAEQQTDNEQLPDNYRETNNQEPRTNNEQPIKTERQEWLANLEATVLVNIEKSDYTIDQLATDMVIGKRQLARRIKELVGVTPSAYIKMIRYTKAHELLENKTYDTVKAVALSVGFKDVINFSRQFKKQFGKVPSEYLD